MTDDKDMSVILPSGWSSWLMDFSGSGYSTLGDSRVNHNDDEHKPFLVSVVEPIETP